MAEPVGARASKAVGVRGIWIFSETCISPYSDARYNILLIHYYHDYNAGGARFRHSSGKRFRRPPCSKICAPS